MGSEMCIRDSIHGSDYRGGDSGQFWNWFDSHWEGRLWAFLTIDPRVSKLKGIFLINKATAHLMCDPVTIALFTMLILFHTIKDPASVTTISSIN